jgi:hypothetical protein
MWENKAILQEPSLFERSLDFGIVSRLVDLTCRFP